ncbi:MAG: hypothetical protein WBP29_06820 [Candidatus Zixiibacteriota bacterium]
MSVNEETIEMIPLLVQGKLNQADAERVKAEIANSRELNAEYSFWQGVYSIRRAMPRFDFSGHPTAEALDRFALGRLNQLSAEYSEIAGHVQECKACVEDIELLRQAVRYLPEDEMETAAKESKSWFSSLESATLISKVVAPVAIALIVVFSAVVIMNRPGEDSLAVRVALSMHNEKRAIVDEGQIPEMQFALKKNTRELTFAFPTDRVELPDYHYNIDLIRRGGESFTVENQELECQPTQLLNQCELKVTDQKILNALKEGGSFSLSIKEEFPEGVNLVPAEYEFYFNVSINE